MQQPSREAEHRTLEEKPMHNKWIFLSLALVAADQLTKFAAEQWLTLHVAKPLLPSLNLTLVYNTGAAFSLMSEFGGWQRWFFIALALVVCALLWSWMGRLEAGQRRSAVAFALVLGGAAGNLGDRLFRGHVVDFVDVYYRDYHWPAFNLADVGITLGALLIIVVAIAGEGRRRAGDTHESSAG